MTNVLKFARREMTPYEQGQFQMRTLVAKAASLREEIAMFADIAYRNRSRRQQVLKCAAQVARLETERDTVLDLIEALLDEEAAKMDLVQIRTTSPIQTLRQGALDYLDSYLECRSVL